MLLKERQGQRFDVGTLRKTLEMLDQTLTAKGRVMAPDKRAELAAAIYEFLTDDSADEASRSGAVLRLLKLT
jgi:hypothetical protein